MRKRIFILVALSLSLLSIATSSATTTQQSVKRSSGAITEAAMLTDVISTPHAGLTLDSYFYNRYKKQTVLREVSQPQQHCNVRANGEDLTVWCKKRIAADHPLDQHLSKAAMQAEVHPDDHVFEITLPNNPASALGLSSQQLSHQTQVSLLQQVSPLIAVALSCLLIVLTVALFHWRETKKSA